MLRKTLVRIVTSVPLFLATTGWVDLAGYAQDSDRAERYFKELDKDNDGRLNSDEFRRLDGRYRDRLEQVGINSDSKLDVKGFVGAMQKVDEIRRKEREDGGDKGSSSSKPKPKARVTVDLPATHTALDVDGDGQIGLYEWERSKFAEFKELDRNGDGFLTPKELVYAAANKGKPAAPPVVLAKPTPVAPARGTVTITPAAPAVAVVASPPEEDKETKQAKTFFKGLDDDDDGKITAEEWAKSRGIRVKFENVGITPTFPLDLPTFTKLYRDSEQKKPAES
jgi:Ca2+-binding EF-hand superfamily protein